MASGRLKGQGLRLAARFLSLIAVASLPAQAVLAQTSGAPGFPDGWLARIALPDATLSATAGVRAEAQGPSWIRFAPQQGVATTAGDAESSPAGPVAPAYDDYFDALGYSFTHGLVAREQLAPLAIGSAAALAFLPFDREISDCVRGEGAVLCRVGEFVAHPITLGALSGSLILGSLATDDVGFRSYAFTLSQGLIVADSLTAAVKLAVRRSRPDGTSKRSFPSGHAAGAFALAAVTSHYYGGKAGVPLYALAALVGLSRVRCGKHFVSDVIIGAAVGYMSARAAIRGTNHVTSTPNGASGSPAPVGANAPSLGPGGGGVSFYLRF